MDARRPPAPIPTMDAYEAACNALHAHRERADAAEVIVARLRGELDAAKRRISGAVYLINSHTDGPGRTAVLLADLRTTLGASRDTNQT